ncbi:hypothetical protein [Priestia aryabhattai]|uniref:hypothetical protein n=1 Tax=Priestia aryabhattai TaxID=412384 RepID=UPI0015F4B2B5|nr:hypothetical protein [Priestia aryabhattai]
MIKKIFQDIATTDKSKKDRLAVDKLLSKLDKDDHEYIVGVDYAPKGSKHRTAVTWVTKGSDGIINVHGTQII